MSSSRPVFPRLPSVWDGPMVLRSPEPESGPAMGPEPRAEELPPPPPPAPPPIDTGLTNDDVLDVTAAVEQVPVTVSVQGVLAAWFADRDMDLESHVDLLLRTYIREVERRG